jgi:hypothetical protein
MANAANQYASDPKGNRLLKQGPKYSQLSPAQLVTSPFAGGRLDMNPVRYPRDRAEEAGIYVEIVS